jgi:enoyl-CoA hydratase/carnithine racemase
LAEEQAQLALPEASVGLLPCAGGTQNLTALVGEGWAKRMILCGERLSAAKAVTIGLVEEVVATGTVLQHALALAGKVANQSPASVSACKQLIQSGRKMPRSQALPLERELFVALFGTEDQQEGVNAFLEKRPAHWRNA